MVIWHLRGEFHLEGRVKVRKDYSGVDGGIGVMEGSLKYDAYTVVMHRKIFSDF